MGKPGDWKLFARHGRISAAEVRWTSKLKKGIQKSLFPHCRWRINQKLADKFFRRNQA